MEDNSRKPVFDHVAAIVGGRLGIDPAAIGPGDSMTEDLAVDSMDVLSIVAQIENQFDVDIPKEIIPRVKTVGEMARTLEESLGLSRVAATANEMAR